MRQFLYRKDNIFLIYIQIIYNKNLFKEDKKSKL